MGTSNAFYLEEDDEPDMGEEWFVGPDDFEDFELVEATDEDRVRLRKAGFRLD
jgi:hypothetical protein